MNSTTATARGSYGVLALGYALIISYGSLVPLQPEPLSFSDALAAFRDIPYLDLGVASRADWVANILLYVPLGFLVAAALRLLGATIAALVALLICVALATAVEFIQLNFPPRTVSQNDLIAESIGSVLGIAIWMLAGQRLARLWHHMRHGTRHALHAVLIAYLITYLLLSLFPYDLLLSFEEFAQKFRAGGVHLLLSADACNGARCGAKLFAEILAMVPVGFLLAVSRGDGRAPSWQTGFMIGAGIGLLIEGLQIVLFSGITQGVSILTRGTGAASGIVLAGMTAGLAFERLRPWLRPATVIAVPVYLVAIAVLSQWQLRIPIDWTQAIAVLEEMHWVPFYYHYYVPEQRALVSLMVQATLYAPVGVLFWSWRSGGWRRLDGAGGRGTAMTLGALTALAVETGRLFLAELRPDSTNLIIAAAASLVAYLLCDALRRWSGPEIESRPGTPATVVAVNEPAAIPPAAAAQPPAQDTDESIDLTAPVVARAGWATRAFALGLMLAAGLLVAHHPIGRAWLAVFLLAYAVAIARYPSLWLVLLPALLPVLDLSPWTGLLFFDAFDAFVLVTLAIYYWGRADAQRHVSRSRVPWIVVLPLIASYGASLYVTLSPLPAIDANSFAHYYSSFSSLRLAKGFVWALLLLPFLRRSVTHQRGGFVLLAGGMLVGLFAQSMVVVVERILFPGLASFSSDFRAIGSFFTMHTGGQHLDAYLAMAMPFTVFFFVEARRALTGIVAVALFALCLHTVLVTFSRGVLVTVIITLVIVTIGIFATSYRSLSRPVKAGLVVTLLATAIGAVALPLLTTTFLSERLDRWKLDLDIRTEHWNRSLALADSTWSTKLFGMGLGSYPRVYARRSEEQNAPGMYEFRAEGTNAYVRLTPGKNIYLGQIVDLDPDHAYLLSVAVRSDVAGAALGLPICEKTLQYSYRCVETEPIVVREPNGEWEVHEQVISTGAVGAPLGERLGRWSKRPVTVAMLAQKRNAAIDVDNLSLLDASGTEKVANGAFSRGGTFWFFGADDHPPWHIFNLWVHLLFEQGALGVIAFALLFVAAFWRLARRGARGDHRAVILAGSLLGFLLVGLFGSLLDAPRLTLLVTWLAFLAFLPYRARRNTREVRHPDSHHPHPKTPKPRK